MDSGTATTTIAPDSIPFLPAADSAAARSALTIFVSIISYRDPETLPTLQSLYSTACHPSRVFAGVVWQVDPVADAAFVFPSPSSSSSTASVPSSHLRQLFLHHTAARGPLYARHLCRRLYGGQQLLLQVDSHMRFVDGWDVQLIDQLYRASTAASPDPSQQRAAVITGYPSGYEVKGSGAHGAKEPPISPSVNVMAASHFAPDGLLRIKGIPLHQRPTPSPTSAAVPSPSSHSHPPQLPSPLPSLFVSAGFLFTSARQLRLPAVPPSSFPFLFFGEELLLSLQCWAAGFDAFHCAPHVAVHCWERGYRKGWREVVGAEGEGEREGKERLSRIMRGEEEAGPWLAKRRGVKEYWEWVGVDWVSKSVSERARRGGVDDRWLNPPHAQAGLSDALLQRVMAFVQPSPASPQLTPQL